jgi:predicted kinase
VAVRSNKLQTVAYGLRLAGNCWQLVASSFDVRQRSYAWPHRPAYRGPRETISAMVDRLVLVNGLPASGKTTLASRLATHLSVPRVSKDTLKELFADAFPAVSTSSLGRIAMETAWSLTAETPGTVILESWWFKPRDLDLVQAGLRRVRPATVVEIWCEVPADLAHQRCLARDRHAVHQDAQRLASCWDDWATRAEPLGVGLTVRVRTDQPVDVGAVAAAALGRDD